MDILRSVSICLVREMANISLLPSLTENSHPIDSNKGSTHHGVSVNDCEDVQYRVTIKNKYENSYLDCNTIDKIERLNVNDPEPIIHTTCQDCNYPLITMINGQLRELFKLRINEEIADNLYWHLTQLLSNHHFNSPTSLNYNSD